MKKFGLVVLVLLSVIFIYQSGTNRTAKKFKKSAKKIGNASGEMYEATKDSAIDTGEAIGVPEAYAWTQKKWNNSELGGLSAKREGKDE